MASKPSPSRRRTRPGRAAAPTSCAVGSLQPHKNLPRLIRAYQQIRGEFPGLDLWVVGRPQPRFSDQAELAGLLKSPGVKLLGYLSEADLMAAYRHARVYCYPSLEEGFGLPLLEAMQAGTLVVTSNLSCLPEIAGPASELVDPLSEEAIAGALRKTLTFSPGRTAAAARRGPRLGRPLRPGRRRRANISSTTRNCWHESAHACFSFPNRARDACSITW